MCGFKLQLEFIVLYSLWKITAFTPSYVIPAYSGFIWWLRLNVSARLKLQISSVRSITGYTQPDFVNEKKVFFIVGYKTTSGRM